ncbi:MAG TPA: DinB family protein [Microlunatus sp.]
MDERCDDCGFSYASVGPGNAAATVRREADRLAEALTGTDPVAASRRPDQGWSALQYGGHVRDVLLAQRERLLSARLQPEFTIVAMGRDERVDWGEYEGLTADRAGAEIRLTAEWLAHSFELLSDEDWARLLNYNYPEPATKSLRWLAAHTVHELVHHGRDVRGLMADDLRRPASH